MSHQFDSLSDDIKIDISDKMNEEAFTAVWSPITTQIGAYDFETFIKAKQMIDNL